MLALQRTRCKLCLVKLSADLDQYQDNVPHSTAWCVALQGQVLTQINYCHTEDTRSNFVFSAVANTT